MCVRQKRFDFSIFCFFAALIISSSLVSAATEQDKDARESILTAANYISPHLYDISSKIFSSLVKVNQPTISGFAVQNVAIPKTGYCATISSSGDYTLANDLPCITISANNVKLDCGGKRIIAGSNNAKGIGMSNVKGISVKNCVISGFMYGVEAMASDSLSFSNNRIVDPKFHGFALYGVTNSGFNENTISISSAAGVKNMMAGFYVGQILANQLPGVKSTRPSNSNTFTNNIISNFSSSGISILYDSYNNVISRNTISNGRNGIEFAGTTSNDIISGNSLANISGLGFSYGKVAISERITENTFVDSKCAPCIASSGNNNIVTNNTVSTNKGICPYWAFTITGNNVTVTGNKVMLNSCNLPDGHISLDIISTESTISNNLVWISSVQSLSKLYGISVKGSGNVVSNNNVTIVPFSSSANLIGMYLLGKLHTIESNYVKATQGFEMSGALNNLISNNIFIVDNAYKPFLFSGVNTETVFNSSLNCQSSSIIGERCRGGNYYFLSNGSSIYNGKDSNGDGIGDIPFSLYRTYIDYLPLAYSSLEPTILPAPVVPLAPAPIFSCATFTYSNWGTCSNGQQTRTVTSSTPSGCIGGTPTTTQSCLGTTRNACSSVTQCSAELECYSGICQPPRDVTPPFVAITYPSATIYNSMNHQNKIDYVFSQDAAACWFNDGVVNSAPVPCGQHFTNVQFQEGKNTITVYARDSANNINSTSLIFFRDTIAPQINYIQGTEATNTILTNKGNISVNVASNAPDLTRLIIKLYKEGILINSIFQQDSSLSFTFTGLDDGIYFFNASAQDYAGNIAHTETYKVTLETYIPPALIVVPEPTPNQTSAPEISTTTITPVPESNATINETQTQIEEPITETVIPAAPPAIPSPEPEPTPLSESQPIQDTEPETTIPIDTIKPVVSIISPQPTTYFSDSINLDVLLNEEGSCIFSMNRGATNNSMVSENNMAFRINITSLPNKVYGIEMYCIDTSGNFERERIEFSVNVSSPLILEPTPEQETNISNSTFILEAESNVTQEQVQNSSQNQSTTPSTSNTTLNATASSNSQQNEETSQSSSSSSSGSSSSSSSTSSSNEENKETKTYAQVIQGNVKKLEQTTKKSNFSIDFTSDLFLYSLIAASILIVFVLVVVAIIQGKSSSPVNDESSE